MNSIHAQNYINIPIYFQFNAIIPSPFDEVIIIIIIIAIIIKYFLNNIPSIKVVLIIMVTMVIIIKLDPKLNNFKFTKQQEDKILSKV